jgi:hypothetical protein
MISLLVACKPVTPAPAVVAPPMYAFDTLDGTTVRIPDPDGRPVVLELVRSLDW